MYNCENYEGELLPQIRVDGSGRYPPPGILSPAYQTDPTIDDLNLFFHRLNTSDTYDLYFLFTVRPDIRNRYLAYTPDGEIFRFGERHSLEHVNENSREEEERLLSSMYPWTSGTGGQLDIYKLLFASRNWSCVDEELPSKERREIQQRLITYQQMWEHIRNVVSLNENIIWGKKKIEARAQAQMHGTTLILPRIGDEAVQDENHIFKIGKWIEEVEEVEEGEGVILPPLEAILYANCTLVERPRVHIDGETEYIKQAREEIEKKIRDVLDDGGGELNEQIKAIKDIFDEEAAAEAAAATEAAAEEAKAKAKAAAEKEGIGERPTKKAKLKGGRKKKKTHRKKKRRKKRICCVGIGCPEWKHCIHVLGDGAKYRPKRKSTLKRMKKCGKRYTSLGKKYKKCMKRERKKTRKRRKRR